MLSHLTCDFLWQPSISLIFNTLNPFYLNFCVCLALLYSVLWATEKTSHFTFSSGSRPISFLHLFSYLLFHPVSVLYPFRLPSLSPWILLSHRIVFVTMSDTVDTILQAAGFSSFTVFGFHQSLCSAVFSLQYIFSLIPIMHQLGSNITNES